MTITPWNTAVQTNPDDASIAWIEPHKSDMDAVPRMPQLVLNIPGLPQNVTLDAKLLVVYERPYAGKQADDTVKIPEDGLFQTVANGRWEIFNQYTNLPFFGGDATLKYKIKEGAEHTIKFAIGGRNPDDIRCKTYTQGRPNATWYAYAIEKHESQSYNSGHYNQFWERGGKSSPVNAGVNYTFTKGVPLSVRSQTESGVGGAGLAQVTGAGGNKTVLGAIKLAQNGRGRRAYLEYLEYLEKRARTIEEIFPMRRWRRYGEVGIWERDLSGSLVGSAEEGFQDLVKTGLPRGSADQASRRA